MRSAGEEWWCCQSCNMELQNIYLNLSVLEQYTTCATSVKALVCWSGQIDVVNSDTSAYYFAEDETS